VLYWLSIESGGRLLVMNLWFHDGEFFDEQNNIVNCSRTTVLLNFCD
jgi:hypothetical protein